MKKPSLNLARLGLLTLLSVSSGAALAGRPLVVDDANVNDAGHGQLEIWASHAQGAKNVYNLAPAFAPIEDLEIGALLARDTNASQTLSALQAKWRITRSQENGCNFGAVLGLAHAPGTPNTRYLNGLLTCNKPELGSLHLNLGASKARGTPKSIGWGVAYEREVIGVTPHIEWFGAEGTKPTIQVGLRGNILQNVQLDGSIGRNDGVNLFTLGAKLQF